jgi:hypothetical protein
VALLPEYNEHLTRDVGALSPALTVVLVALGVDAIPHTTFHASHLEGFPAADTTDQTIGTVLQVALVTAWHAAGSGRPPPPQDRALPHHQLPRPAPTRTRRRGDHRPGLRPKLAVVTGTARPTRATDCP